MQKSKIPVLKALLKSLGNSKQARQLHSAIEAEQQAYTLYKFHSTVLDAWTNKINGEEITREK